MTSAVVWRCHAEVYDLALYQGKVIAATSGGALIETSPGVWIELGKGPGAFRHFIEERGGLAAVDRAGSVYELRNGTWTATSRIANAGSGSLPQLTVRYRGEDLTSTWGSKALMNRSGREAIPRDPAEGDYALLTDGDRLIAGTSEGIYVWTGKSWTKPKLPSPLPALRPQGAAFGEKETIVGGIGGVFLKRSGQWSRVSDDPVRQVMKAGAYTWVLYGSGALDKFDLVKQQRVFDPFSGMVRRPWTSCIANLEGKLAFGGQGGWVERGPKGYTEHYFPEINKDVVVAIAGRGDVRWIGTQQSGLLRYDNNVLKRWNPGNGLPDAWVTALLHTPDGLYVATANAGLFLLKGDQLQRVEAPSSRIRHLALWNGRLVIGGMDGSYELERGVWKALPTYGEETTALTTWKNRLVVCTVGGIYFL